MKRMFCLICLISSLSVFGNNYRSKLMNMKNELFKNKNVSHAHKHKKHAYLMTDDTFRFFISELKNTWPDYEKYKVYLKYLVKYDLTVKQLVKISSLITFDKNKIETISLLYPCVTDKENAIELVNAVNDKDSLIKILKQK